MSHTIDFENFIEIIKEKLFLKASNNKDMDALISFVEIGIPIKNIEMTRLFCSWLKHTGMVDYTKIINPGYIHCKVNESFFEMQLQNRLFK